VVSNNEPEPSIAWKFVMVLANLLWVIALAVGGIIYGRQEVILENQSKIRQSVAVLQEQIMAPKQVWTERILKLEVMHSPTNHQHVTLKPIEPSR